MNNLTFGGLDRVRGRAFAYYETIAGGMGASALSDGASATHTHMTNSWNTPVEAFEHLYPLRIRATGFARARAEPESIAAAMEIVREFEFLTRADVTILSDRRERGPYGLFGGGPGARGRNSLLRGKRTIAIPGKARFEVRGWGRAPHRIARRRRVRQPPEQCGRPGAGLRSCIGAMLPDLIRPFIPAGLELDTFDKAAWVGLVPFEIYDFPGIPHFPETNLRTYVVGPDGSRAVWFFSLEAARLPAVLGARIGYHFPYFWANMGVKSQGAAIHYRSGRHWPHDSGAMTDILIQPGDLYTIGRTHGARSFPHRPLSPLHHVRKTHHVRKPAAARRHRAFTVAPGAGQRATNSADFV